MPHANPDRSPAAFRLFEAGVLAAALLLALPAEAATPGFEVLLDTSLLCLDRIDGNYLKSWLNGRGAYASPPFGKGGYTWFNETGFTLFGEQLAWVFLSDREIGAIFNASAGEVAQKIGKSWLGLPYTLLKPGFYQASTFSVIWDIQGGQSELICRDD